MEIVQKYIRTMVWLTTEQSNESPSIQGILYIHQVVEVWTPSLYDWGLCTSFSPFLLSSSTYKYIFAQWAYFISTLRLCFFLWTVVKVITENLSAIISRIIIFWVISWHHYWRYRKIILYFLLPQAYSFFDVHLQLEAQFCSIPPPYLSTNVTLC